MAISIKMRGPTSLYNLWFTRYGIWPFLDQIWILILVLQTLVMISIQKKKSCILILQLYVANPDWPSRLLRSNISSTQRIDHSSVRIVFCQFLEFSLHAQKSVLTKKIMKTIIKCKFKQISVKLSDVFFGLCYILLLIQGFEALALFSIKIKCEVLSLLRIH